MLRAQILIVFIFYLPFGNIEKYLKHIFTKAALFEEISTYCFPFSIKVLLSSKVLYDKEGMKDEHNEDKDHGRDTKNSQNDGKGIGSKSSTKININIFYRVVVHYQDAHYKHQQQLNK